MLLKDKYPILEFDDDTDALINPRQLQERYGVLPSDCLIITFFRDALHMLLEDGKIVEYLTLRGENDLVLYKYTDRDVFLMHGTVGCPACAGFLDELTGIGIRRVMFCGGGGVLDAHIGVGDLLVVEGAIRDEGFSYHYVKPSRVIYTDREVQERICAYLDAQRLPYLRGLTWTTDAFYRETREKIALRRKEGAKIVEMEQSGCIAVAQFRGIKYGAIIYGGDDVSGEAWDQRGWTERKSIRYALIDTCRDLVEQI